MNPLEYLKNLKKKSDEKDNENIKSENTKAVYKISKVKEFNELKSKLKKPNSIIKILLIIFIICDVKYLFKLSIYLGLFNFYGKFADITDLLNSFLSKWANPIIEFNKETVIFLFVYYFLVNILLIILINYLCLTKFDYKNGIIVTSIMIVVNLSSLLAGYMDISVWIMCLCAIIILSICFYSYRKTSNINLEDESNLDIEIKEDYIV